MASLKSTRCSCRISRVHQHLLVKRPFSLPFPFNFLFFTCPFSFMFLLFPGSFVFLCFSFSFPFFYPFPFLFFLSFFFPFPLLFRSFSFPSSPFPFLSTPSPSLSSLRALYGINTQGILFLTFEISKWGIAIWEGPIANLSFLHFVKTNVHKLHILVFASFGDCSYIYNIYIYVRMYVHVYMYMCMYM